MTDGARRCPTCDRAFGDEVLFCPADGSPLVSATGPSGPDPYVGQSILGHISIEKLVGIGSMARVYRAFQKGVDRHVAVKILHRELTANPEIVERFRREARVASKLSHPHVVSVLMLAELEQSGELVIVTEYLDGLSLRSALEAAGGALSLPRALHVVLQACDAVSHAHAEGVVHRDLKPENVMLVRRGNDPDFVKVLDFGLARLLTRDATYATRAGAVFGSPRYISPEGAEGRPVGPPADVYALATILYQCLSGRTPFEAETPVALLLAHATETPRRVTEHARASYVPAEIADVIDLSLRKREDERPRDARAFGQALAAAAARSGIDVDALSGSSGWKVADVATSLGSLASTRTMHLGRTAVRGTEILDAPGTGTLSSPLDPVPASTSSGVAPTLYDAPIAVASTRVDEPGPASRPSFPSASYPGASTPPPPPSLPLPTAAGATLTTPPLDPPRRRVPTLALVLLCFALGAVAAATLAGRFGLSRPAVTLAPADALFAEAEEARARRAWDAPASGNVRDLVVRGRSDFPDDARFLDLARRSSLEITMAAVEERQAGRTPDALRLARVALSLDPSNQTARGLVRELSGGGSTAVPTAPAVPTVPSSKPPRGSPPTAVPSAPPRPSDSADPPPDGGRWL
jgi:serine/threonine-protein kinase